MNDQQKFALAMAKKAPRLLLTLPARLDYSRLFDEAKDMPRALWEDGLKHFLSTLWELIQTVIGLLVWVIAVLLYPIGAPLYAWYIYSVWARMKPEYFVGSRRHYEKHWGDAAP